jgi:hypothetical protein
LKAKSPGIEHHAEPNQQITEAQMRLLQFAKNVADLMHEGEPGNDGQPFDRTSEDTIAALNQLILEARELVGTADTCGDCGETVAYVIGCPDGAEICQGCFDTSQH